MAELSIFIDESGDFGANSKFELLRCKLEAQELSASELAFFGSTDRLRRDYLKPLNKLRFGSAE